MEIPESLDSWEQVAPAWERHRARLFENTKAVSDRLLDAVGAGPGMTILELAAGTGETSFEAAARVGGSGKVICTDFSPSMLDAACREGDRRGLANVEYRVMDAQAIDLPDGSVDAVVSRYGLMLMPDPAAAMRGARRALRPDGAFAYAVWGAPAANLWIVLLGAALLQNGFETPGDAFGPGGMFSLAEAERNVVLLHEAGFTEVETDQVVIPLRFASFDDYWDFHMEIAGPLAVVMNELPEEDRARVRATAESSVTASRADDGSLEFPSTTLIAIAR